MIRITASSNLLHSNELLKTLYGGAYEWFFFIFQWKQNTNIEDEIQYVHVIMSFMYA